MKKMLIFISLVMILSVFLAACGNGQETSNDKQDSATGTSGSGNNDTRVVQDAKGKVKIPADPQRIADISGSTEQLLILGHQPVATANTDPYAREQLASYLGDRLKDTKIVGFYMTDQVDIEALAASNPDLIFMNSRQEKIYGKLKKIAPVVVLKGDYNDWRMRLKEVGKILGQEKEAQKWLDQYDQKAQKLGQKIKDQTGSGTFSVILANQKSFILFGHGGAGEMIYDDMNLPMPKSSPIGDSKSFVQVTMEGIASLNPDYIIMMGTDGTKSDLSSSAVWKSLKAVKNHHVYYLNDQPYYGQSFMPIGKKAMLDKFQEMLLKSQ